MLLAIIEDDERTRENNAELFAKAGTVNLSVVVRSFSSAESYLFAAITPDLLVLDIRLTGADGMTLAKKIRQVDATVPLVFLSNYEEYVFEGYDVNALAYIMKPLTSGKVAHILHKVTKLKPPAGIVVKTDDGTRRINLFDLLVVEVLNHELLFHTQQGVIRSSGQLKDFSNLTKQGFVQVYRSVLVNLSFIRRLSPSLVDMADGTQYPLSRKQAAKVKQAFFTHYRKLADND